jgi:NhaP-type Na+/H+ or K+/H+ antiporter
VSTQLDDRRAARQRLRDERRRRRYRLIDSLVGVAIAIVAFIIAPGIGIVALLALLVLGLCGASLIASRRRGRRAVRPPAGAHRLQSDTDALPRSRRRSA